LCCALASACAQGGDAGERREWQHRGQETYGGGVGGVQACEPSCAGRGSARPEGACEHTVEFYQGEHHQGEHRSEHRDEHRDEDRGEHQGEHQCEDL
jgi:hypothetical protein